SQTSRPAISGGFDLRGNRTAHRRKCRDDPLPDSLRKTCIAHRSRRKTTMNHEQTDQAKHPDLTGINQAVHEGLRSHQQKVRWLDGAAFLLGFLAIAASFMVVIGYFVFYRPKEKEVLRQVTLAAERAKTQNSSESLNPREPKLPFDFPSVQATM